MPILSSTYLIYLSIYLFLQIYNYNCYLRLDQIVDRWYYRNIFSLGIERTISDISINLYKKRHKLICSNFG